MNEFLTPADAALILRVTPAAVRLMARRGELAVAAKTERGNHLFERAEVERLREEREARDGADKA